MTLLRTFYLWIVLSVITFTMGFLVLPFAFVRAGGVVHWWATLWGTLIAKISNLQIKVENPEKLYRDGPIIVVSNHQSMFDIPVFYSFLNIQFRWMAKASLFKIPVVGWAMSGAGYIPVDRGERKKAMESLFYAADQVRSGKSVLIFPEGTRSTEEDGTMLPFKKGGFILAKKAGVVIQPITIWGVNKVMPVQKQNKIQRIYKGKAKVVIHDPVQPQEYENLSADELADMIRKIIERPIDRLRKMDAAVDKEGLHVHT